VNWGIVDFELKAGIEDLGPTSTQRSMSAILRAIHGRLHLCIGVLLLALMSSSCSYSDAATNAYATRAEAESAGAIERGWVPRGLPPGAYELREAHSLNSSRRWGLFNFEAADREALRAVLLPDEISLAGIRSEPPLRVEWWPLLLRRDPAPEQLEIAGLKAYRFKDEPIVIVVNWSQGRAYYWSV
jgi:hypothetical protein